MNTNSDIRTSGRLMTLATVICCAFAAVALISVLRNSESLQAAAVATKCLIFYS